MDNFYTTKKVAEICGISVDRVIQIYHEKGIGRRFGHEILFTEEELTILKNRRTIPGKVPKDGNKKTAGDQPAV